MRRGDGALREGEDDRGEEVTAETPITRLLPTPSSREQRAMIEDFVPLAASFDWRLGECFWSTAGLRSYVTHEIPNMANNDGMGARRAADVLFASCADADARGALEASIEVLEVGVGLGLHARLLLDHFRARCRAEGRDYYDRLTFYAADVSRTVALELGQRGVFENHAGRVRVGHLAAIEAGTLVDAATGEAVSLAGRLRAVFCNYVLDVMPFTALRYRGAGLEELRVKTYVRDLSHARHDAAEFAAAARGEREIEDFVDEHSFLQLEREFFAVDAAKLPGAEHLAQFVERVLAPAYERVGRPADGLHFAHSYGAIAALDAMTRSLRGDGFVLCNDFGAVTPDEFVDAHTHRRFGRSAAMGLNFPEVEWYCTRQRSPRLFVSEPPGDSPHGLHARLFSPSALRGVHEAFRTAFDRAGYEALAEAMSRGRAAVARGDASGAEQAFGRACEIESGNWFALLSLGRALRVTSRDPERARAVFERALEINPVASVELWNEYGDALFETKRDAEALAAYGHAMEIDPQHPRAFLGSAKVALAGGRYADAIDHAGRALARDVDGESMTEVLEVQSAALSRMHAARDAEKERLRTRFG